MLLLLLVTSWRSNHCGGFDLLYPSQLRLFSLLNLLFMLVDLTCKDLCLWNRALGVLTLIILGVDNSMVEPTLILRLHLILECLSPLWNFHGCHPLSLNLITFTPFKFLCLFLLKCHQILIYFILNRLRLCDRSILKRLLLIQLLPGYVRKALLWFLRTWLNFLIRDRFLLPF